MSAQDAVRLRHGRAFVWDDGEVEEVSLKSLRKYNESHDEGGRFAETGSAAAARGIAMAKVQEAKTPAEVQSALRELLGTKMRIDGRVGLKHAQMIARGVIRVEANFPGTCKDIRMFGMMSQADSKTMAWVNSGDYGLVYLSARYFGEGREEYNEKVYASNVAKGWFAGQSAEDTVVHELGHIWASQAFGSATSGQRAAMEEIRSAGRDSFSTYGDKNPREFLAEAFVVANGPGDDAGYIRDLLEQAKEL